MRIAAVIGALVTLGAMAQSGSPVSVLLDHDTIPLGGRAMLTIVVDGQGSPVAWPVIGDTLNAHIEVVGMGGIDTTAEMQLVRKLALTSFDSGYWAVPPFTFTIAAREVESEALLLHVQGVRLDSAAVPADMKPIHEPPFSMLWFMRAHWEWFAAGGAMVLAVALVLLVLRRMRRKQPAQEAPVMDVPLHERVLAALDALDRERLWQQGEHKAYQSRLTDLLRGYIEERFQVPALERTTDELLYELRVSPLNTEQQNLLGNMLRLADMVKFAKALPSPQENEQMMSSALRFVRDTMPTHDAPRS
ncbi:MAG: hypothetical protein IPL52_16185 [Flavobacteriales bacterium]|nr:hypothetical protein [Flavobacteriales bacterium]